MSIKVTFEYIQRVVVLLTLQWLSEVFLISCITQLFSVLHKNILIN